MESTLRDEIIQAENHRIDLMKWKLFAVATLGGVALGLTQAGHPQPVLLCLIPFVCAYVDLLCYHVHIRNVVIGMFERWYRDGNDELASYEAFVRTVSEFHPQECDHCVLQHRDFLRDSGLEKLCSWRVWKDRAERMLRGSSDSSGQAAFSAERRFVQYVEIAGHLKRVLSRECVYRSNRCELLGRLCLRNFVRYSVKIEKDHPAGASALSRTTQTLLELKRKRRNLENAFGLENWVLILSTIIICILIALYGVAYPFIEAGATSPKITAKTVTIATALFLSALLGALFTSYFHTKFLRVQDAVRYCAKHHLEKTMTEP